MFFSQLADIQSSFQSFFTSLTSALSYNLLFFIALGVELFLIVLFSIMARFSYESRMRRSLDMLNRWLFKNKSLSRDNIKEFSNLIKKAPKRLVSYWQQYILYREKAPSEYVSTKNIVDKPLRTSSFASSIQNFIYISLVWALVTFTFGIAYQNTTDGLSISPALLITALIIPIIILALCVVTVIIMRARKNVNLDELYQNLHLFHRFIDNACVDLPPYIDYSLLFTAQEIDKGIPALREYLESRARKEKEAFDKIAEEDALNYEKYDFGSLDIDGQNILERAMKESEAYLIKRDKTMAQIAQVEAALESSKRNFENIQKEFQKKMQVYKENIDRLRQQQEETTNRIESNYLRKQQQQEVTKQEREQAEFETSQSKYLVQKGEYEQLIESLKEEMSGGKGEVEEAMMSEYETFYAKLYNTALTEAEHKVEGKLSNLTEKNKTIEEDLTNKEAQLKRVIDENEILKRKLGIEDEKIEEESAQYLPQIEPEPEPEPTERLVRPEEVAQAVEEKADEVREMRENVAGATVEEFTPTVEEFTPTVEEFVPTEEAEEAQPEQAEAPTQDAGDFEFLADNAQEKKPARKKAAKKETPKTEAATGKRRGRPRKGEEKTLEEMVATKKTRGRPRKTTVEPKQPAAPKKRGRPAGSTKKPAAPATEKRGRGRPKKTISDINEINKKIDDEQKRLSDIRDRLDNEIQKAIRDLDKNTSTRERQDELMSEIEALKNTVENAKATSSASEIEKINARIEELFQEIKKLNQ